MKILSDSVTDSLPPLAATIGFFDGVHCGHRFLIHQVKEAATVEKLCPALITFPTHPRQVIRTDYRPRLLSAPQEKLELLATTEVDYCILLPFTPELAGLSAHEFMQQLRERFNIRTLVIGYDHRFGHNRSENFEDYVRYGHELDMHIVRAHAYTEGDAGVSSSAIRQLLQKGDVTCANRYLGYRYFLNGTVVNGHKMGRKLGFPTANLRVDCSDKLIPAEGVYAVHVYVQGEKYDGMLNIGCRPTLDNGEDVSIEVNIFHFSGDIYGQAMRIEFMAYLRSEQKYNSLDALISQMQRDREAAIFFLASSS